jgi:hypothetical protein
LDLTRRELRRGRSSLLRPCGLRVVLFARSGFGAGHVHCALGLWVLCIRLWLGAGKERGILNLHRLSRANLELFVERVLLCGVWSLTRRRSYARCASETYMSRRRQGFGHNSRNILVLESSPHEIQRAFITTRVGLRPTRQPLILNRTTNKRGTFSSSSKSSETANSIQMRLQYRALHL